MSEWTVDTFKEHFDALREADQRALRIKEEADKVALGLARDIQIYKDEKANELREQINRERNLYVTNDKFDAAIKPFSDLANRGTGAGDLWKIILSILTGAAIVWGFFK